MPNEAKTYDYPQVRPPSSNIQPRFSSYIQTPARDDRYSWVPNPAEAEGRMWPQNQNTQSQIPPLPQIPDQYHTTAANVEADSLISNLPDTLQNTVQPQDYTNEAIPTYDTSLNQSISPPAVNQPHQQYTSVQPPIQSHQYSEQVKKPLKIIPQSRQSLVPDANVLMPTSPTNLDIKMKTTNMAIIAPSDSSQLTVGNYTPTPQPIRGGTWQHGFYSCAEPSICMTALLCPCVVYGKSQYRLGLKSEKKDPTNMLGYNAVNGSCMAFGLLCGINSILATIQHTRIRKAYSMNGEAGNVAEHCLKSLCCCCCVVAQDEKELKFREEQARRVGGAGRKEGYIAPVGMSFAPPPI